MQRFTRQLSDEELMALALRLGRRGQGNTAENPAVGCVIARQDVDGTTILGRGWTQTGGRPHAERVALAEAGVAARGATAYVTLEPCSHHGKSPPCAEALIEAGIARVVAAHPDPDPRVGGRGFAMLEAVGIQTETGLLESIAHRDLAGFLSRTVRRRPWLQAKMALSKDGKIGMPNVPNHPITGKLAKNKTYALRATADAILIGSQTVRIDDPALTVRSPGLTQHSPIRIILDGAGTLSHDSQLVKSARDVPVWILATGRIAADKALLLEEAGCRLFLFDESPSGHVPLDAAMRRLAGEGINTLFAECGAALAAALISVDLIDEFFLYRSGSCVGPDGIPAFKTSADQVMKQAGLHRERQESLGKDRMEVYIRPQSLSDLYGAPSDWAPVE
ncbi:bifunctional diaminohydroxyphosphoribosylaminopyrimidine deaminase/5-amino-6-(5-phosphoribosylamino)uracil reductase RibD [Cohaesibacter sp. CAU 1516]|uniref:bifunctional diaminohydroxyphosphoribosylaminopyrimidine deaminase/5-amino-6-(5-phosphoribosylamino)uracil reductase RibD n=1 Tax=Cohaesibacter sp. CAU 1516 TaxID=2576038 RepID=UPI00148582A7|nr:bifunctional diaminohydroxyphosphoribosylaminopyrimidine deaminase/5-amino-6-(5-phosphoribosylamino)uracil reductase RibD [Cohaesibacter sp. CAU 1516]